jgi:hypothetical protein
MDLREVGYEDGSGWNWLRIMCNGGLWYYISDVEPSGSATRYFVYY